MPSKSFIQNQLGGFGILCLGILLLYLIVIFPFISGNIYAEFDLREQYIPWRLYYKLSLSRGELGLWNPFLYRGYDHLGEGQSGILHPAHMLLYFFFPATSAMSLEIALVFPFAFTGMFLLLKQSAKLETISAIIMGSGLFAISPFMIAHIPHVNMIWVYSHLPWMLFFLERIYNTRYSEKYAIMFGSGMASMLLLGHPQMVWIIAIALVLSFISLIFTRTIKLSPRPTLVLSLGLLGGLLIGMLQILPTIDYFTQSSRSILKPLERENFSLHPLNLLIHFSPDLFIDKCVGDWFYNNDMSFEFLNSHQEYPSYIGITVMTIIMSGIFLIDNSLLRNHAVIRRQWLAGGIWFFIFILLSFGKYGGLYQFLQHIPYISQFRSPARYFSLVLFGTAFLSALMLDRISCQQILIKITRPVTILILLPSLISVFLCIIGSLSPYINFRDTRLYLGTLKMLANGPILGISILILIYLLYTGKKYISSYLCLLCLIDIAIYSFPILSAMELRSLRQVDSAYEKMSSEDHLFRHVASINQPLWQGAYLVNGYLGISPKDNWQYFTNKKHLQLTSVRYAHSSTIMFKVTGAFPRVRLVPNLIKSTNPLHDLEIIDLKQTALCYPEFGTEMKGPPLESDELVSLEYDGGDKLSINVNVRYTRLLIISDRYTASWEAQIDGRKINIIPLFDKSIRGIVVSSDDKIVTLKYRSPALIRGICSAILGISILLILFFNSKRRNSESKNLF